MFKKEIHLTYVFDALCGWCYGFSDVIVAFQNAHPEVSVRAVSGGLFVGNRKAEIGRLSYLSRANERITALTGANFGRPYRALVEEGTLLLDSEAAAVGFVALRTLAPARAVALAASVQRAFFAEGKDLSKASTYRDIAEAAGIDPMAVDELLADPETLSQARRDFAEARGLGATGFPTLLLESGGRMIQFAQGVAALRDLEERLARVASPGSAAAAPSAL